MKLEKKLKIKITYESAQNLVRKKCVYGVKHFCDGTPNKSEKGEGIKPPCKFYKKGRCENIELQTNLRTIK